jgi:hypothetical protein
MVEQLDVNEVNAEVSLGLESRPRNVKIAAIKAAHEHESAALGPGLELGGHVGTNPVKACLFDRIQFLVQGPFPAL